MPYISQLSIFVCYIMITLIVLPKLNTAKTWIKAIALVVFAPSIIIILLAFRKEDDVIRDFRRKRLKHKK